MKQPIARRGFLDRYFGDFALARAKLTVFRVCFFTLVGIDGLRQIEHAPRYGAGDFNVGHFAWLDAILPAPSRVAMLLIFLWQAYLALSIACGRASRAALWLLTALYGYGYFVSQLDSYQHHYLVFLLLLVGCLVPWHGVADDHEAHDDQPMVSSFAVRLIVVQVAIVYLWAGVTKLERSWLEGTVLAAQLQGGTTQDMAEWLGMGRAATVVMLAEFLLCGALLWRKLWPYAVVVGCGLHAGIEFGAEFKIGIFSFYMFAFYLLLLPDRWYIALARKARPLRDWMAERGSWLVARPGSYWAAACLALAVGALCVSRVPIGEASILAITCSLFSVASFLWYYVERRDAGGRWRALVVILAHALAGLVIIAHLWSTDYVADYYKYWGGSARRMGQWDEAESAYRRLVELRPDWAPAHYHLARIDASHGHEAEALAGYARAQRANPEDYRSFLAAAEIHHQAKRGAEAVALARAALDILKSSPGSANAARDAERAQRIVDSWPGVGPAP